jgi:hypothetical protein
MKTPNQKLYDALGIVQIGLVILMVGIALRVVALIWKALQ